MVEKLQARNPYVNNITAAYVTAVNILAVEFLIKHNEPDLYSYYIRQIYELNEWELTSLFVLLDLNMHTSSLGAMITQGDYDNQRDTLLDFLRNKSMLKEGV